MSLKKTERLEGLRLNRGRLRNRAIAAAAVRRALSKTSIGVGSALLFIFRCLWGGGLALGAAGWLAGVSAPVWMSETSSFYAWGASLGCVLSAALWGAWDWRLWSKSPSPIWSRGWSGRLSKATAFCLKPLMIFILRLDWWIEDGLFLEQEDLVGGGQFRRFKKDWEGWVDQPRSARECVEPLRQALSLLGIGIGQWFLAIGSAILAVAGVCLALALAPLAATEQAMALCLKRSEEGGGGVPRGMSFGVGALVMHAGKLVFFVAPFAMMVSVAHAVGDRSLSTQAVAVLAAIGLALCAATLRMARAAPGAFNAGWMKRPASAGLASLIWVVERKHGEQSEADEEWRGRRKLGQDLSTVKWIATEAPRTCWRWGLIGAGLGMIQIGVVGLLVEALAWGLIDAARGVLSGKASASIKAGLSTLEKEGAADFSRAEREVLGGVADGRAGEAKRKGPSRL